MSSWLDAFPVVEHRLFNLWLSRKARNNSSSTQGGRAPLTADHSAPRARAMIIRTYVGLVVEPKSRLRVRRCSDSMLADVLRHFVFDGSFEHVRAYSRLHLVPCQPSDRLYSWHVLWSAPCTITDRSSTAPEGHPRSRLGSVPRSDLVHVRGMRE